MDPMIAVLLFFGGLGVVFVVGWHKLAVEAALRQRKIDYEQKYGESQRRK
jgi:hypothetical protein